MHDLPSTMTAAELAALQASFAVALLTLAATVYIRVERERRTAGPLATWSAIAAVGCGILAVSLSGAISGWLAVGVLVSAIAGIASAVGAEYVFGALAQLAD